MCLFSCFLSLFLGRKVFIVEGDNPPSPFKIPAEVLSQSSEPSSSEPSSSTRSGVARQWLFGPNGYPKVCMFCGDDSSSLQCAHLVPHANTTIPLPLFFQHRASINHASNHVLACHNCHTLFDLGAFYVDPDDDFAIIRCDHIERLNLNAPGLAQHFHDKLATHMRVPPQDIPGASFFPFTARSDFFKAWRWRKTWFDWNQDRVARAAGIDAASAHLAVLSISARNVCNMCHERDRNQKCVSLLCAPCCRVVTQIVCKVHTSKRK